MFLGIGKKVSRASPTGLLSEATVNPTSTTVEGNEPPACPLIGPSWARGIRDDLGYFEVRIFRCVTFSLLEWATFWYVFACCIHAYLHYLDIYRVIKKANILYSQIKAIDPNLLIQDQPTPSWHQCIVYYIHIIFSYIFTIKINLMKLPVPLDPIGDSLLLARRCLALDFGTDARSESGYHHPWPGVLWGVLSLATLTYRNCG